MSKNKKVKKRHSLRLKMLAINLAISFSCLILCGTLFVMSVLLLVGKYVKHDLDFLLTEVCENLEQRFQYMENVIYEVRGSEEMMRFLAEPEVREDNMQEWYEKFAYQADISNLSNQVGENGPIVEKIYLFRPDGVNISSFYYALLYSEIEESNQLVEDVWKEYRKKKEGQPEGGYFIKNNRLYIAYPVKNNSMEKKGDLIFEVNLHAVEEIMSEVGNYDNAFWMLIADDMILDGSYNEKIESEILEVSKKEEMKPFAYKMGQASYRTYTHELCVQMNVVVGIPENQTLILLYDSLNLYIVGIVVILLMGLASFVIFTSKMTKPIEEVAQKLSMVREGNFETKLPDYDNEEFHEISRKFNQMTEYINQLIKQVYEKQISIKEMELKFLQTQMNPHFMFNVLNAIALQARIDGNEEISDLLSTFCRLIQAKIYRSDTEKVKICQELEYAEYYLRIQKFRYGEGLSYSVSVEEEEILQMWIPKLCIQLIVENAVVHGLEPKLGEGKVEVHIMRNENGIQIDVVDDGVGFEIDGEVTLPIQNKPADAAHNHVGLNNVNHIIKLMYGEEYGIKIRTKKDEGSRISICIPCDRNEN